MSAVAEISPVKFQRKQKDHRVTKEILESMPRYVIFFGECKEGKLPIPPQEMNIGMREIERSIVTQIENHSYYDRDQDDRNSIHPRHPEKERKHEIKITVRAAQIADWLERRWGSQGLAILESATKQSEDMIARTVALIFPIPSSTLRFMPLNELRDTIEANFNSALEKDRFPDMDFALEVKNAFLLGIERAENYCLAVLAQMKGEMEQRRVSNGKGIAKLDARAHRMLKLLNRSASEYEVDGQSLQQALISQLGKNTSQAQDPTVLAGTIAAVLQALGLVPGVQVQPAPEPEIKIMTGGTDDKPSFEGVEVDVESVVLTPPKKSKK